MMVVCEKIVLKFSQNLLSKGPFALGDDDDDFYSKGPVRT